MLALFVIEAEPGANAGLCLGDTGIGMQVDLLIALIRRRDFHLENEIPQAMEDLDFVTRLERSGQTADEAEPVRKPLNGELQRLCKADREGAAVLDSLKILVP